VGEDIYEFMKEYCEWAGHDMEWCVEHSLLDGMRAGLENVHSTPIPKAGGL